MIWVHLLIVLAVIVLGARYGSIAIGAAGGLRVIALAIAGAPVTGDDIPFDVIGIIMSGIAAIAAMQAAGGMDWLVAQTDKLLRKQPKRTTLFAPMVTYFLTIFAGTGHTAFAALPVVTEVAKENQIRPTRPLSIAVVASQMAITASPISAAVVFLASILEPMGVGCLTLLGIAIPSTFLAVIITSFVANWLGTPLSEDPVYLERKEKGQVKFRGKVQYTEKPGAKASVLIFLLAIVAVVSYAALISDNLQVIADPTLPRTEAIMSIMLAAAMAITVFCRVEPGRILEMATFRSGVSACVCVLGVAWLGTTFVNAHIDEITDVAGATLSTKPWLLAVVLFFAATLLYSQAATAKALMPTALALGVGPVAAIAAFPAVSALFVLPTYPTLLAAVEMDDTGSTRVGKAVFNHPFMIPGVVNIAIAVAFGFLFGSLLI